MVRRMSRRVTSGAIRGGGYDDRRRLALKLRQPKRGNDRPLHVWRARESLDRRALVYLPADDRPRLLVALSVLAGRGRGRRSGGEILASLVWIDFYGITVLDVQRVARRHENRRRRSRLGESDPGLRQERGRQTPAGRPVQLRTKTFLLGNFLRCNSFTPLRRRLVVHRNTSMELPVRALRRSSGSC